MPIGKNFYDINRNCKKKKKKLQMSNYTDNFYVTKSEVCLL